MMSSQVEKSNRNTTRKQESTGRKSNEDKILAYLKEQKERKTTTEISTGTGIDVKNITRYLKKLEEARKITRETVQDGKVRTIYIKLLTSRNKKDTTRKQETSTTKKKKISPETSKTPKSTPKRKQDLSILLEKIDHFMEENLKLKRENEALRNAPTKPLEAILRSYASKWMVGSGKYPQSEGNYDTVKKWLDKLTGGEPF